MAFTTGTEPTSITPPVTFTGTTIFEGGPISSVVVGPDGRLYASFLGGELTRWDIDVSTGGLSNEQTFAGLSGRAIIGIVFDPLDPNVLWVAHNAPMFPQPAPDWTGTISKLTLGGSGFSATVQDYVVGLPRSAKDHLSNSLAFGPDGMLYLTQGSNSAMGAPDGAWYNRPSGCSARPCSRSTRGCRPGCPSTSGPRA